MHITQQITDKIGGVLYHVCGGFTFQEEGATCMKLTKLVASYSNLILI